MLSRISRAVLGTAAASVDRAATLAASAGTRGRRGRSRASMLSHGERLEHLGQIAERYDALAAEGAYFRDPRPIEPASRPVRTLDDGGRVEDLSWQSDYATFLPEMAERFERHRANHHAAARAFLHPTPKPTIVLIHGYLGGQYRAEERVFPVNYLYRRGLDVLLFVLPFHGVRADRARSGPPPFPGADPRISNEGFRQAVADLRDLISWSRQRGGQDIGLMGMSLGGYTTSLAATVERQLAFAIPVIPLSSLADFARDNGRLGRSPTERTPQHAALDRVHRIVSPLHRPLLLEAERVLIIGAEADRITPIAHARRLSRHFQAPLETWPGGHLLQVGRSEKFRRVGRFLREIGFMEERPGVD